MLRPSARGSFRAVHNWKRFPRKSLERMNEWSQREMKREKANNARGNKFLHWFNWKCAERAADVMSSTPRSGRALGVNKLLWRSIPSRLIFNFHLESSSLGDSSHVWIIMTHTSTIFDLGPPQLSVRSSRSEISTFLAAFALRAPRKRLPSDSFQFALSWKLH